MAEVASSSLGSPAPTNDSFESRSAHYQSLLDELHGRAEQVRRLLPGGTRLAIRTGRRQWDRTVEQGLQGVEATFEPPDRLARERRH